jgi:cysteine synthase
MTVETAYTPTPENFVYTTFQRRLNFREAEAGILPVDQLTTPTARNEQYVRLRSMIGNTPLLAFDGPRHSLILAKVESQNPTESHYDRAYVETLEKLETDGVIRPGDELVELTSGSAGISFAWLCNRLGYKARIIIPPELKEAPGRVQEMSNFGAELDYSAPGYIPAANARLKELLAQYEIDGYEVKMRAGRNREERRVDYAVITAQKDDHRVCVVNHSDNYLTIKAFQQIGREMSAIIPRGASASYLVSAIGNWTQTIGISTGLKERFKGIKVVGVEGMDNPVCYNEKYPGRYAEEFGAEPDFQVHDNFGNSARGIRARFTDVNALDEIRLVDRNVRDAIKREFNTGKPTVETIGNTSAMCLQIARELAEREPGAVIFLPFYDKADRYHKLDLPWKVPGVKHYPTDPVFEKASIPPLGWKQWMAETPVDLPTSLVQAYGRPEHVRQANLDRMRIKAA